MSELPTSIGQFDGLSGHLVAVDCDGIARWNTAAHGGLGRQTAASPTGGPLVFDGVQGVVWSGRGGMRVRGVAGASGWQHVDVVSVAAPAMLAQGPSVGSIVLSQSRLFIGDLGTLSNWAPGQGLDGKTALRISGRDAALVAGEGQLPPLADGSFGWTDMPDVQAAQWKRWVEQQVERGWSVKLDYQPHDHRYTAEMQIAASAVRAGQVNVGADSCVVLDVRQSAGHFPVVSLLDLQGRLCGVRIFLELAQQAPGPMTATPKSLTSTAAEHVQTLTAKASSDAFKQSMPRWIWPLLPDGRSDFSTRVRAFGQERFLALVAGCLFSGCAMMVLLGGLFGLLLYLLY